MTIRPATILPVQRKQNPRRARGGGGGAPQRARLGISEHQVGFTSKYGGVDALRFSVLDLEPSLRIMLLTVKKNVEARCSGSQQSGSRGLGSHPSLSLEQTCPHLKAAGAPATLARCPTSDLNRRCASDSLSSSMVGVTLKGAYKSPEDS
jgi:hypothetical protein